MSEARAETLGQLRQTDYRYRPVKIELRENLITHLRSGRPLFPGLVGYDTTVIPQLINGILARHDLLLLGLRGQAKTRILRSLPDLLEEWIPVVAEADVWDDPLCPSLHATRRILDGQGDETKLRWIHRSQRYHEKLATPDVTIADLLGEVDLVKHAEGRYLSDEETMHFGLVPRSNRGIFAINELPDLAPRIQVGLFNVLEERDVQIRGFPVRLNLDLLLVFSANPEDYTSRGRIVTPLKDRIGTVVRTHYPYSNADAMRITLENVASDQHDRPLELPAYVHEVIEEIVRLARNSPHVAQQSGVSVRTSIAAFEVVVANAERRALRYDERAIVPRISDLDNIMAACRGKIELMLAEDETAEDKLIKALIGEAIKNVSESYLDVLELEGVVTQFAGGQVNVEVGDDVPAAEILAKTEQVKHLHEFARSVCRQAQAAARDEASGDAAVGNAAATRIENRESKFENLKSGIEDLKSEIEDRESEIEGRESRIESQGSKIENPKSKIENPDDPLHLASAIEFILEALHVHDKLSKYLFRERTFYRQ